MVLAGGEQAANLNKIRGWTNWDFRHALRVVVFSSFIISFSQNRNCVNLIHQASNGKNVFN
jgi:hypothetical protein